MAFDQTARAIERANRNEVLALLTGRRTGTFWSIWVGLRDKMSTYFSKKIVCFSGQGSLSVSELCRPNPELAIPERALQRFVQDGEDQPVSVGC